MTDASSKYWAVLPDKECVQHCQQLESRYREACAEKGLPGAWNFLYAQAYGWDADRLNQGNSGVGIQAYGDVDGADSLRFHTNLAKPYNRQAILLAMGDRAGFQAIATNLDAKSEAQVPLCGKLLDYVTTQAGVDSVVYDAAEANQWFGAGFVHITWDLNKGDLVDTMEQAIDPETGEPLMVPDESGQLVPYMKPAKKQSGSVKYTRCFPWGVCRDVLLEESPWTIVYEPVSRFELAGQFPALADEILKASGPNAEESYQLLGFSTSTATSDVVILKHMYHRACKAVPGGRWLGYVGGTPLWSRRCPVQDGSLPVVEICTMKYFGCALGHPEAASTAAQQEAFDNLLSAGIENMARYAKQPLFIDERVKYDGEKDMYILPDGAKPPQTATYQQIPEAVKFMLEFLPAKMRESLGLNDTSLGNPPGANMSGVAIASLTQTAIKLQRTTQLAIDSAFNDIGNVTLALIRANATDGMVAEIAGHTDAPLVRFFSQQDLAGVRRVKIIRTSPVLNTIAGKMELVKILDGRPVDQQRKIVELFTTNRLEALTGDDESQTDLLRWENEELTAGRAVTVSALDDPKIHVVCHRTQMDKIRMQPDSPEKLTAIQAFGEHIAEHTRAWLGADPATLELLGIPAPASKPQPAPVSPAPSPTSAAHSESLEPAPAQPAKPHANYPR